MPLPVPINYVAPNGDIKTVGVQSGPRPSGYAPTPEYFPTRKVVKCSGCGGVGIAEFVNGFNLRDGDRLMEGRTIRGACLRCNKETDFVPLAHISPDAEGHLRMLYEIQRALDASVRRGEPMRSDGLIVPVAKQEQWEANERRRNADARRNDAENHPAG